MHANVRQPLTGGGTDTANDRFEILPIGWTKCLSFAGRLTELFAKARNARQQPSHVLDSVRLDRHGASTALVIASEFDGLAGRLWSR